MLYITVPATDLWDEKNEVFLYPKGITLQMEHSLISLSKWESKWKKPFLGKSEKTEEETLDYIRCMTITPNVNPIVYNCLTPDNIKEINDYIGDSMTATTFYEEPHGPQKRETITAELIYFWMISYNIPPEYQKWHLNRLLTLIRVCSIKNAPPKKHSRSELLRRQAAINAARRQKYNTKG